MQNDLATIIKKYNKCADSNYCDCKRCNLNKIYEIPFGGNCALRARMCDLIQAIEDYAEEVKDE